MHLPMIPCQALSPLTKHLMHLTFIFRKGQALQFNWLYDKGAFILHPDETFSVDFSRV